ncbi:ATP-binding protein [Deferribacter abyssi]|uniref:ATP-binding protein n=1 Tax=Deferribacter abyssi TaxID=213806 RepID=UPI003C2028A7
MFRVLYVEDDFQSFKLVELVLKKYNIKVILAKDGLEAIELAEKIAPDLIIMDINLPKLKGYEAAAIIKSNKATNHIPIIALTAVSDSNYEKLSMLAGCDAFYTKPIDPQKFGKEIITYIEQRKFDEKEIDFLSKEISVSLKHKTEELVKLEKIVLNLNYKLNKILSSLPDAIFIIKKDFTIEYMNTEGLKLKITDNKFLNTSYFFDIFSTIDYPLEDLKDNLIKLNKLSGIYLTLNNDSKRFFLTTFSTIDNNYLVTLKEITNIKKFEENVQHIEKLATIGQITSGIIHEINNPITAVKNYLTALKNTINNENQLSILEKIEFGIDRISTLSNNLMTFTRKPSGKKYPLNINHIIKTVFAFSEYEIKRGNVNVVFNLDENLPLILGNKTSIEQLVLNILINANHAANEKENPEIHIKTHSDDKNIFLEITDNGNGIPEEIRNKIFDPFFTTKPEGKGTGLGLAIVKKIVEDHNANITFKTGKNGTKFVIKFPKYEKE